MPILNPQRRGRPAKKKLITLRIKAPSSVKKPSKKPHSGHCTPSMDFVTAYTMFSTPPKHFYKTTGNRAVFYALATKSKSGPRKGNDVIHFITDERVFARAYSCCWKHEYNCYKTATHIACYTMAL